MIEFLVAFQKVLIAGTDKNEANLLYTFVLTETSTKSCWICMHFFKSVVFEECWTFETFSSGQIKVDPTDSTCSKSTSHSSTYVLNQFKQNTSNKIVFEAIPGATESIWRGYIEILEDTKLTKETLKLKKLGWNTNELVFTLTVPLCPSSVWCHLKNQVQSLASLHLPNQVPSILSTNQSIQLSCPTPSYKQL
jgi:hypothetical protein